MARWIAVALLVGCGEDPAALVGRGRASGVLADAGSALSGAAVDVRVPPAGVKDRGRASGLALLEVGGALRCGVALVASNVAIAPVKCLTRLGACRWSDAAAIAIRSGDPPHEGIATVREIVAVDPCDDDALVGLVLAANADGIAALAVRARPSVVGEFVRVVAMEKEKPTRVARMLRDHLRVTSANNSTFAVAGSSCGVMPGSIAIDEATGELVGVAAGANAPCEESAAPFDLVQIDGARALVERALAKGGDATRTGKPFRPTTDLGEPCDDALGCAAGVCVMDGAGYCSRSCGPGDRCPTGLRCERLGSVGASFCVRSTR